MLQRLLSIVLFAATVLPTAAPVLLAGPMAAASVPLCCRRNGAHHCDGMMSMGLAQAASGQPTARAPRMQCPFQQRSLGAAHLQTFAVAPAANETVGLLREPAPAAQAECLRRIAFDRARQKRGPPAARLS